MANIITYSEYDAYDDLPSPADNATQIQNAIASATAWIENQTGRVFEVVGDPSPVVETVIVSGLGGRYLYVANSPITALTTLEYWDGRAWVEYDAITTPYTFKTGTNHIYFTQGHKFYKGRDNIRVTFEYGYASAFPTDLKYACYLMAKHEVDNSERLGIKRQEDGEQNFWYDHKPPEEMAKVVRRYKHTW
jgi:hypothetical protein